MIFELIIQAIFGVIALIGELMPNIAMPGWFNDVSAHVGYVTQHMAGLGVWVPFTEAGTALVFVMTAAGVAVVIKLVRIVASFATAGGGSAA